MNLTIPSESFPSAAPKQRPDAKLFPGRSYNQVMTTTAKENIRQLLDEMPDDASYRDIEYRIYLRRKVDQGLEDARQGRVLGQEEVEKRMAKWLDG